MRVLLQIILLKYSLIFYQFTCIMKSKEFNHWMDNKTEQTIDFVFIFSYITHRLTIPMKLMRQIIDIPNFKISNKIK